MATTYTVRLEIQGNMINVWNTSNSTEADNVGNSFKANPFVSKIIVLEQENKNTPKQLKP